MLSLFASSLVDTSLRVSAAIVLLLCLRPVLRRWIGSRALAWLWLAVVARLLFPLPVSMPWSVPALLPMPAAEAAAYRLHVSVAPSDALTGPVTAVPPQHASPLQTRSWQDVLSWLWLLGTSLVAIRLAHGWRITRRWSARTLPADTHPGLQAGYLALPAGLRREVALRLTDALDVPTLVGVLRPQIWLPRTLPDTLTAAELRHVLLHELGHARRRDLLAQWLCSLACCLHWFNPLVWLLARVARTDRELACDAWVLSRDAMQAEPASFYGHTLLKVVEGMSPRTPPRALPAVSMAAGKRHLGLRVREIRAFRPVTPWRGALALAAVTALVAALTLQGTTAAPDTGATSPTPQSPASSPSLSPVSPFNGSPASAMAVSATPAASPQPLQVEIEPKFIEIAKSTALKLERSAPRSSPLAGIFHQIFAPLTLPASAASPAIFRSSLVLPDDFQLLVRQLNQEKSVDLLSAPRVTAKSGQRATIELVREFVYATAFERGQDPAGKPLTTATAFDKTNVGVTLDVVPTIESTGDMIDLSLTWKITNFDGFVDAKGKPVPDDGGKVSVNFPTFDTHSVSTVASLSSGATVVFSKDDQHLFARSLRLAMGKQDRKTVPKEEDERLLLIFVTAKLVEPAGVAQTRTAGFGNHPPATEVPEIHKTDQADQSPAQSAGSPTSLPYGVPVPDKPGFVTSPYAPDAGDVDLHGFARGQEVRDPYTDKLFLVP